MPEDAPEETQDTPTPEPSDSADSGAPDSPAPEVDWQERYNNLQPEYTRASQEAAQYRQIVDLARQGNAEAIEWLGLDLADEDGDDDSEPDYRDPRVDQLLEAEAQRQSEAELDQLETHVESRVEQLAKKAGLTLSDNEIDLIFGALTPGADGNPDVDAAFAKVTGLKDHYIESYRKSKKASPVEIGSAGTESIDLTNDDERVRYLANLLEAGESA